MIIAHLEFHDVNIAMPRSLAKRPLRFRIDNLKKSFSSIVRITDLQPAYQFAFVFLCRRCQKAFGTFGVF